MYVMPANIAPTKITVTLVLGSLALERMWPMLNKAYRSSATSTRNAGPNSSHIPMSMIGLVGALLAVRTAKPPARMCSYGAVVANVVSGALQWTQKCLSGVLG